MPNGSHLTGSSSLDMALAATGFLDRRIVERLAWLEARDKEVEVHGRADRGREALNRPDC